MTKASDEWMTPQDLFNKLNEEFDFKLDVACTIKNSLCENGIYVENESALDSSWWIWTYVDGDLFRDREISCWMNPPYSRNLGWRFVQKAFEESQKGCTVVGLLKFDPSTSWFKDYIYGKAHEVRMCYKRVRFVNPETGKQEGSPTFPSCIVVWKPTIPTETKFSIYEW